jgi:hypothetical protein
MAYQKRRRGSPSANGGGKRAYRSRRGGGAGYRKGSRPVYKARRSNGITLRRPTPTSLFKTVNPVKYITFAQMYLATGAGQQVVKTSFATPNLSDLSLMFGSAFTSSLNNQSKLAYQAIRHDELTYQAKVPGELTIYRCRARGNFLPTGPNQRMDSYINSLLATNPGTEVSLYIPTGGAAPPVNTVIGWTPFDNSTFCQMFKITKVTKKYLRVGSRWKRTFKSAPRIRPYSDVAQYNSWAVPTSAKSNGDAGGTGLLGILKGDYVEIWQLRGGVGILTTGVDGFGNGTVTTTQAEIAMLTRWDYLYAPEPNSGAKDKYIQYEVPNPLFGLSTAATTDMNTNTVSMTNDGPTALGSLTF